MLSFGYAHWTDKVRKQIKLHAGTVDVDIPWWHVDALKTYDVDCDGDVFSQGAEEMEEVHIDFLRDADDDIKEIRITCEPIMPGFYLEFKFLIHNAGRLAIQSHDHNVMWIAMDEPLDEPEFLDETNGYPWDVDFPGVETGYWVPDGFEYTEILYLHDPALPCTDKPCLTIAHYTQAVAPTTYSLKPCQSVLLKEIINANIQEYPEYQCHWFRLTKELIFSEKVPEEYSSFGMPLVPDE
jgi:hypothetical protein